MSMIPGVTNLPVPSMTTASAGASTDAPTAAIFPSRSRIAPLWTAGPAAVRIVTLRMTVGFDGRGWYVLGNGSAFGVEVAPSPAFAADFVVLSELRCGEGACAAGAELQAAAMSSAASAAVRIAGEILHVG